MSFVTKGAAHFSFSFCFYYLHEYYLLMCEGIGLSDTLGAFLAGLLLSETSYRYQIEADIAPFRGLLLGFFFITVGFSIDTKLIFREVEEALLPL